MRKPYLKWAGNKLPLFSFIKPYLKPNKNFYEPFGGSCAVSLNLNSDDFENIIISDLNKDLINCHLHIQQNKEDFITYAHSFFTPESNQASIYYQLRDKFNSTENLEEKAALFIYLNRHCFNGLCRYNQKGKFNVPIGKYKTPYFPKEELRTFYKTLDKSIFIEGSFEEVLKKAEPKSTIYLDPPYVEWSETSNFTSYVSKEFGLDLQTKLTEEALRLRNELDCVVVISNHATPLTFELYKEADYIKSFEVQRYISAKGSSRKKVTELLAVYDKDFN